MPPVAKRPAAKSKRILARALAYPFAIPDRSFVYHDGAVDAFDAGATRGRVPVIALGSNRSPVQLKRKFGAIKNSTIPVERAWLDGYDVVFTAHIAGYGSISAMLFPSPGTRVEISLNWFAPEQLPVMHETEGLGDFYAYARVDKPSLRPEFSACPAHVYAYLCRRGALDVNGRPAAHAAIKAKGRNFVALTQLEAQAYAHVHHGDGGTVEDFILQNVARRDLRHAREARMAERAHKFDWADALVENPG
ncbi:MAG: hypothetical protein AB7G15_06830 [Alphaproteobacteria bacterium]